MVWYLEIVGKWWKISLKKGTGVKAISKILRLCLFLQFCCCLLCGCFNLLLGFPTANLWPLWRVQPHWLNVYYNVLIVILTQSSQWAYNEQVEFIAQEGLNWEPAVFQIQWFQVKGVFIIFWQIYWKRKKLDWWPDYVQFSYSKDRNGKMLITLFMCGV